jgi:hypothetical protein
VVVPIRLPHRFSNPFDEEAVFVNTITPGFFVRYFEHLEELIGEGKVLTPEVNKAALRRFATVPVSQEDIDDIESKSGIVVQTEGEKYVDQVAAEKAVAVSA